MWQRSRGAAIRLERSSSWVDSIATAPILFFPCGIRRLVESLNRITETNSKFRNQKCRILYDWQKFKKCVDSDENRYLVVVEIAYCESESKIVISDLEWQFAINFAFWFAILDPIFSILYYFNCRFAITSNPKKQEVSETHSKLMSYRHFYSAILNFHNL